MSNPSADPIDLGQWLAPGKLVGLLSSIGKWFGRYGIIPAIIGVVVASLLYGLLPAIGVKQFVELLSFKKILMISFLMAGGVAYWIFLDFIKRRPIWLMFAAFVGLPLLVYTANSALNNGINIYKNLWLIVGVCVPAAYMVWPHFKTIWQRLPYYKIFILYLLVAGYFYTFNHHLVFDQRFNDGSQPMGFHLFFQLIYHFLTVTIVACAFCFEKRPRQIFNAFNQVVLWVTLIYSVVSLVFYPTHFFTEFLEEVHRTRFLFLFTNEYSFYMQFLVTYLLGIYFYQFEAPENQKQFTDKKVRFPWQVMYPVTIVLGTIAMMTSFTKTSIGVLAFVVAVILLYNGARVLKQKALVIGLAALPFVMLFGALVFQVTTDTDLMAGVEARMNNSASMDWRERVWDYLLDDMPVSTWFTGHGFTAASERMKIFEVYVENEDGTSNGSQVLAVHNSYLQQLYDLGILGIVLMLAMAGYALQIIWRLGFFPKKRDAVAVVPENAGALRALDIALLAVILTYLILCYVNNTFYMIEQPFWFMTTVLWLSRPGIAGQMTSNLNTNSTAQNDRPQPLMEYVDVSSK